MRIVSWNINSIRLRLPLVKRLVRTLAPDVLCLQEIKCPNDAFPEKAVRALGFEHVLVNGIKGYHGVAILSRVPFARTGRHDFCGRADGRHLEAVFATESGPLRVHNFYVPAGGDEPDPKRNDKFAHKLAFLAEMKREFARSRGGALGRGARMVLLGDLNIAPYEHDVWSSRQLQNVVSHTPVERAALDALRHTRDWEDVARRFVPDDEKLYSWWSYRARDWAASDRGRRLDHIWITPALRRAVADFGILRKARGWPRPSDHVPVRLDLALKPKN